MVDIRVDDDPRKQSARQLRKKDDEKKGRGLGGFLFDLIMKSLLMTIVLSIDFTLFANAGTYNLFNSYGSLSLEAIFIYAGIAALSLIVMFLSMLIIPIENLVLSAVFAVTGIAIINQFALFDKQSGLIILFGEWLSNDVNVILYKYSYWIMAGIMFVISYIIIHILKRSLLFYFTLALAGLCGWVISEAYFNSAKPLFKQLAAQPAKMGAEVGKNLVFLALNDFVSINNLRNLKETTSVATNADKAFNNALGMLTENNFTIYPNVIIDRGSQAFTNLTKFYNADVDNVQEDLSTITQDSYFDFGILHPETQYLTQSSLFESLKKQGYEINAYQIGGMDICKLGNGQLVDSCYEKINYPLIIQSDKASLVDRIVLMVSQWIVSTGLVNNVNPVLEIAKYAVDGVKPYSFYVNKLNSLNSFAVFDMILSDMERKGGNQAYFAVVDLPSETFVYDDFCTLKPINQWISKDNIPMAQTMMINRQNAYFDQTSCLYGYLNKFMKQLAITGMDSNTTIIIAGLNMPSLFENPQESDLYRSLQSSQQIGFAIKSPKSSKYSFDYKVCEAKDILGSYFFGKKQCKDLSVFKTTNKNLEHIKKEINIDMFNEKIINSAKKYFNKWFIDWARNRNYIPRDTSDDVPNMGSKEDNEPVELSTPSVTTKEIQDEPEDKLESIAKVASQTEENGQAEVAPEEFQGGKVMLADEIAEEEQQPTEVIPDTLFDNGIKVEETSEDVSEKVEEEQQPQQQQEPSSEVKNELQNMVNNLSDSLNNETMFEDDEVEKVEQREIPVVENVPEKEPVRQVQVDNPKQGYDLNKAIQEAKMRAQQTEKQVQNNVENNVQQQKEAVKNVVMQTKQAVNNTVTQAKQAVENNSTVEKQKAEKQMTKEQKELQKILVAPKTNGQKLSPEELKKQYHEMLKQAQSGSKSANIEIVN